MVVMEMQSLGNEQMEAAEIQEKKKRQSRMFMKCFATGILICIVSFVGGGSMVGAIFGAGLILAAIVGAGITDS